MPGKTKRDDPFVTFQKKLTRLWEICQSEKMSSFSAVHTPVLLTQAHTHTHTHTHTQTYHHLKLNSPPTNYCLEYNSPFPSSLQEVTEFTNLENLLPEPVSPEI